MEIRQHNLIARHRHIDGDGERFEKRFKGGVSVPEKSQEELDLQRQQIELLKSQKAESDMFKPYLLESMNLVEENGQLREMTEAEKELKISDDEKQMRELTRLALQEQRLAAEGKLPVSPALEQSINDEQKYLVESLSKKLGRNYASSTPAIQSLGNFNQKAVAMKDESRRGQLNAGSSLLLNQMGYLSNAGQQNTNNYMVTPLRAQPTFQGLSAASAPYYQNNAGILNNSMNNATINAQANAGYARLAGQMIGAVGGSMTGGSMTGGGGTTTQLGNPNSPLLTGNNSYYLNYKRW